MLKSVFVLCLTVLSGYAFSQNTIRGFVKDKKTKEALAGASVVLKDGTRFTTTDENGYYQFEHLSQSSYEVEVRLLGYKPSSATISESTSRDATIIWMDEDVVMTDEVIVSATRVSEKMPTTFSNVSKSFIQKQNFGQDLPFVLNWTPSLVTTSDAGAGVGYTGMRIRGSDATRINVTINGIPLNDSEEQGVFWVDVPDIATSAQNIQIQRGVGTSTNGAGAFGASINLQTNTRNDKPYADVINSVGSFGTHRHTVGFGTGLINKNFVFDGRLSQVKSDGFVDRASSDLKSYYLSGGFYGAKTMLKAIVFGGREITYQSWWGVPESRLNNDVAAMNETALAEGWNADQLSNLINSSSRTFNAYTYKNQVDNYAQDHHQLHFSHRFNHRLTLNAALHHTYGRGYYEEYRYDDKFSNYGLSDVVIGGETISSTNLVRRRWLNNHFYGATYSLSYETDKLTSVLGGAVNRYVGDHYGEVVWAKVAPVSNDYRYYFNSGDKRDFTIFWKNTYQLNEKISAFFDLQYRGINYSASGKENKQQDFSFAKRFNFFNPKAGLTYSLTSGENIYASYSVGHREPVRSDFVDATAGTEPKAENLRNVEVGYRLRKNNSILNINYYLMDYKNQLVLTGKINDVGAAIRTNVSRSYRTGVEVDGSVRLNTHWQWAANFTLSQNKIHNFTEVLYDYGANFDQYNEVIKNYKKTDISFSPSLIAGSGLFYHPVSFLEVGLLTKYVGRQYLDNTSNGKRKIDPYFLNDVRITYTWKPAFLRELSLSLLANNIFDVKYSSNGYTYGYFGGDTEYRQNYFYPQAGRNYLLMMSVRF